MKLSLSRNALTFIEPSGFKDLWSLSLLDLSHNNLIYLEHKAFDGLQSLQTLYLQNNLLQNLENNSFYDLIHLQYLFLHDNNLTTLNGEAFEIFTSRKEITLEIWLSGNPLKCDKRLCWLLTDIDRIKIKWNVEVRSNISRRRNCSEPKIDCSVKHSDQSREWTTGRLTLSL